MVYPIALGACLMFAGQVLAQTAPVDFRRDIQPIFTKSCMPCHSAAQGSGQYRLDSREGALVAIKPGSSRESRLIQRVKGAAGMRMPLAGKPLDPAQIAALERWIDAGAPWPEDPAAKPAQPLKHWSYVKPERPPVPQPKNAAWVRNPIDAFILARLEKEGLKPSPEARRETLIRRLSLDLTGLPPSPAEIDAFRADTASGAWERLVDRLLASPHYGERQARSWLDLARYADTHGHEKDDRRSIWKYRDWVIDAFNRDLPYDRFTIEQIAGDMLPGAGQSQLIATGFHRNTMYNEEGGVDKDEAHWENLVDRVNVTATIWLGSTVACAQCHNHKFDPFSQQEYYRLMAFYNNTERTVRAYGDTTFKYIEPVLDLPTPEQETRRSELRAEMAKLDALIKAETPERAAEQAEWEKGILAAAADWKALEPAAVRSTGGAALSKQPENAILASGANPGADDYVIEAKLPMGNITAVMLEALPHASLPRGGPGRDSYGNFFLTEFQAEVLRGKDSEPLTFCKTTADDGRISDRKFSQLWSVDASRDEQRLPRRMVFTTDGPFGAPGDTIRIRIVQRSEFGGQGVGHFRLAVTSSAEPERIVRISPKLRPLLARQQRTESERRSLTEYFRNIAPSTETERQRLREARRELDALGIVTTLVMGEAKSFERPSAVIRLRGNFTSTGETVYAGTPAVLHPFPESEMPNRLGLARWLVSTENPLAARVAVNRIWEQYFGRGIVETSEDFGSQGERPSHPELLDWLATEFIARNQSMKQMHRLIVTSATYRQSSVVSPALQERDPYNRLLARGPRFRVEAEMVRDVALATSGLLSRKIGGPSVFPYQPEGIWDMPFNDDKWTESTGEDRYRRALYTFVRRTAPYPSMAAFDAPSRELCTVRRVRTNTPLQALTTLNDPAFFEAAQALAKRVMAEAGPADRDRAAYGFLLAVAREPKPAELDRVLAAIKKERAFFTAQPEQAGKLGGPEQAAWTIVANVLLNLDETLTKE